MLMARILEFFGDILTGTPPERVQPGPLNVNVYPNPSAGSFRFGFRLEEGSAVKIDIFDLTGRCVSEIPSSYFSPGFHEIDWKAPVSDEALVNGIFFYRLVTSEGSSAGKLLLSR
jgi:hypothetical protein